MNANISYAYLIGGIIVSIMVMVAFFVNHLLNKQLSYLTDFQSKIKNSENTLYDFCVIVPSMKLDAQYAYILVRPKDSEAKYQFLVSGLVADIPALIEEYKLKIENMDHVKSSDYLTAIKLLSETSADTEDVAVNTAD